MLTDLVARKGVHKQPVRRLFVVVEIAFEQQWASNPHIPRLLNPAQLPLVVKDIHLHFRHAGPAGRKLRHRVGGGVQRVAHIRVPGHQRAKGQIRWLAEVVTVRSGHQRANCEIRCLAEVVSSLAVSHMPLIVRSTVQGRRVTLRVCVLAIKKGEIGKSQIVS